MTVLLPIPQQRVKKLSENLYGPGELLHHGVLTTSCVSFPDGWCYIRMYSSDWRIWVQYKQRERALGWLERALGKLLNRPILDSLRVL